MTDSETYFAGIETGGQSIAIAIAKNTPTNIIEKHVVPTTTYEETIAAVRKWLEGKTFVSLGIASFGPVDLNPNSPTYGYITTTPKTVWRNKDVVGPFRSFGVPIGFDTDVNAPAVSEMLYGGHGDVKSTCYITLGTGVGVGICVNGTPIHGLVHPEGGHILVPRHPLDVDFDGVCEKHGPCIEGMVNSDSIAARKGIPREALASIPDDDEVWDIAAHYVAHLCATLTYILSPEVIVLGGGIMKRPCILPMVQEKLLRLLNGYIQSEKILQHIDKYVVRSTFETQSGLVGALTLAQVAYESHQD